VNFKGKKKSIAKARRKKITKGRSKRLKTIYLHLLSSSNPPLLLRN
jgi:hypothetical protein